MSQITTSNHASDTDAINAAADWREALFNVAEYRVANRLCFSSGEIAALIRNTVAPRTREFWFSVTGLGAELRNLVWADTFQYDDGQGNPMSVVQIARTTVGKGRTGSGITVFVYGPDATDALKHEFEVDIPDFNAAASAIASDGSQAAVQGGSGVMHPGVRNLSIHRGPTPIPPPRKRLAPNARKASVAKDGRMYVNRSIIEALCAAANWPFRVGDPVYVTIDSTEKEARLSLQINGGKSYQLWSTGRAVFGDAGSSLFVVGNTHPVSIVHDKAKNTYEAVVALSTTC